MRLFFLVLNGTPVPIESETKVVLADEVPQRAGLALNEKERERERDKIRVTFDSRLFRFIRNPFAPLFRFFIYRERDTSSIHRTPFPFSRY